MKDIALLCNVSIGTVDRVLHNRGEVAAETRENILKKIEELGFQPNILASTLALKKPLLFATLFPTPLSVEGYWNKPQLGIRRRSEELNHYRLEIESFSFNQSSAADFEEQAGKMLAVHPDGIILAPYFYKESLDLVAHLRENAIPFVFIDSEIPGQGQVAYVGQNSYQCGYLSARLLSSVIRSTGLLQVIHFAKEMDNQNHLLQREKGFYEWFRQNEPERVVRTSEIGDAETGSCDSKLLSILSESETAGIFVTNSKVHYAADTLEKHKLRDIRLIGHDLLKENVEFLKMGWVDFLICQRPEEQGYNALEILFRHVVQRAPVQSNNYTPIDILIRENVDYYKEFK